MDPLQQMLQQLNMLAQQVQTMQQTGGQPPANPPAAAPQLPNMNPAPAAAPQMASPQQPTGPGTPADWASVSANMQNQLANAVNQIQQTSFQNTVAAMAPSASVGDPMFDATPIAPNVNMTWGQWRQQGMTGMQLQNLVAYEKALEEFRGQQQQQNVDNSWVPGNNARSTPTVTSNQVPNGTPAQPGGRPGPNGGSPNNPIAANFDKALASALNGNATAEQFVMGALDHSIHSGPSMQNTPGATTH